MMEKLVIQGGTRLHGEVSISGAKNAALPIILAAILAEDDVVIHNVPRLQDVKTSFDLLHQLGIPHTRDGEHSYIIKACCQHSHIAPYELVKTMRASVLVLGPLLTKCGHAEVSLPGGCAIGARPVDLHIDGLRQMGAHIVVEKQARRAGCPGGPRRGRSQT